MSNLWQKYRGCIINVREIYETTEERLARGDYQSRVIGSSFHLWLPVEGGRKRRMKNESEEYPNVGIAFDMAQGIIDAIVDNLD